MSEPTALAGFRFRNSLRIAGAIAPLLLAAACQPASDTPAADTAAPNDAGASTANDASPATSAFSGSSGSASADAGAPALSPRAIELARMQAHLDSLYAPSDVVHRFTTALGDAVDCVPFEKQPGFAAVGSLAGAPPALATQSQLTLRPAAVAGFGEGADAAGNVRVCPTGAVPIRHLDISELARFATLEDFLAKAPRGTAAPSGTPAPNGTATLGPDGNFHEHGYYWSSVENWGAQSTFNLWTPAVAPSTFSLSQLWIFGGTGNALQTVEAGYTADRYRHPDDADSRLFIYSTTNAYHGANKTDCYDLDCKAFVQLADTHVLLGGKFDKSSIFDGEQREFTLRWQLCPASECQAWEGWWLRYDGGATSEWVGFYPRSHFGASGALADHGDLIEFGGEVTYAPGPMHPTTDMGSGQVWSAGFGRAAYQTNLLRITTNHSWASFGSTLVYNAEAPTCYDAGPLITSPRVAEQTFFFGGNGYSEVCK
jgi:hypothetical protein